jgi:hypothetical protein
MERGGAQAVPCRPGQAGQGRLARHRQELRADEDPDAGRQPRAEVLPPAEQHGEEEAPVQPLRHGMRMQAPTSLSFFSVRNCLSFDNRVQRQVPICENSASISDPLDVARHGVASADSERAAVDVDLMNSTTEGDDGRSRDVVSSASGAGTALRFPAAAAQTEPLHPSSSHGHGRGHHCSPLDLELGMSLPAPSVGT